MIIPNMTEFPTNMAMGATRSGRLAYEAGRIMAVEARAVGIHWPGPTCCDVNTNPNNPIINTRTFGDDPQLVADMASSLVKGLQEHGTIAWGYHFPGHGATGEDSHMEMPVLRFGMERLQKIDLVPFKALIESGVRAICSAHIWYPELEPEENLPASLSKRILTGLLREQLGYENVISSDSLAMQAIRKNFDIEDAVVMAFDAGTDVLLAYPDTEKCYQALLRAIDGNPERERQLEASVRRILKLKETVGINQNRFVEMERLQEVVGIEEHQDQALEIARKAITVIRGESFIHSLPDRKQNLFLIGESRETRNDKSLPHRKVADELRKGYPEAHFYEVGNEISPELESEILTSARRADSVVSVLFTRVQAYDPSGVRTSDSVKNLMSKLSSALPTGVVICGNPYTANQFSDLECIVLAYDVAPASLTAAVELMKGEIRAEGRPPVKLEV
jgi:beta-N-acetylhexosaminidase